MRKILVIASVLFFCRSAFSSENFFKEDSTIMFHSVEQYLCVAKNGTTQRTDELIDNELKSKAYPSTVVIQNGKLLFTDIAPAYYPSNGNQKLTRYETWLTEASINQQRISEDGTKIYIEYFIGPHSFRFLDLQNASHQRNQRLDELRHVVLDLISGSFIVLNLPMDNCRQRQKSGTITVLNGTVELEKEL
jgi:hypothetical protein